MKKSLTTEPNTLNKPSSPEAELPPPSTVTNSKQPPFQKNLVTLVGLLTTKGSRICCEFLSTPPPSEETQSREVLRDEKALSLVKMRFWEVGIGCFGERRFHDMGWGWLVGVWRVNGMRIWRCNYMNFQNEEQFWIEEERRIKGWEAKGYWRIQFYFFLMVAAKVHWWSHGLMTIDLLL